MTPELARATLGAIEQRQAELEAEDAALEQLAQACTHYLMVVGAPYDGRTEQPGRSGPAGAADPGEVEVALPPSPVAAPNPQPGSEVMEDEAAAGSSRDLPALPPDPASHTCPRCERAFRTAHAVRIHLARGHREEKPPAPTNGATEEPRDPRVIDEPCRKCGQRFRWRPALVNHERACRGTRDAISA